MIPNSPKSPELLKVRILSPRQVVFEGEAYSVSSKNSQGNFDILPQHANFITLIEKNVIKITKKDLSVSTFPISFAILYQMNNQVNIYTELEFK